MDFFNHNPSELYPIIGLSCNILAVYLLMVGRFWENAITWPGWLRFLSFLFETKCKYASLYGFLFLLLGFTFQLISAWQNLTITLPRP